jgi:ABC-type sulfate transport system permease component
MTEIPDPSIVNPGTVGAIVVFCLFVAVALVIRSGYKRLRNLDRRREDEN